MLLIPIMRIDFDAEISPAEVPAFRGAVIEKVGVGQEIFHNHNNEEGGNGYHYRYPLIQYKALEGRPAILFIGEAVAEAATFSGSRIGSCTSRTGSYEPGWCAPKRRSTK